MEARSVVAKHVKGWQQSMQYVAIFLDPTLSSKMFNEQYKFVMSVKTKFKLMSKLETWDSHWVLKTTFQRKSSFEPKV